MRDNFLWVESYRPKTIKDCILPAGLKKKLQDIVDAGEIPNHIFSGLPGCGKTTSARAIGEELKMDTLFINASLEGNIDTLRTKIKQFASTISLQGGRKLLILDEADGLNVQSTQPALRPFIEEYSKNAAFIMTANNPNKLLAALDSRCPVIDFRFPKAERPKLAVQFMNRMKTILTKEKIKFDDESLGIIITKYFPDFRKIVGNLQTLCISGKLDPTAVSPEINLSELVKAMKVKDLGKMQKWLVDQGEGDSSRLFRNLYDALKDHMIPGSIPQAIVTLGQYQYWDAFAADKEINAAACLVELSMNCEWK